MTREGPLPPPSADEVASDKFIRNTPASPGHRALVLSDAGGHWFHADCPQCPYRGIRWYGAAAKAEAAQDAEWHNERGEDEEAQS